MSSKFTSSPRKYSKRNFVELLEIITPDLYRIEDLALSGVGVDPISEIINSNIRAAANISTVLPLSAVPNSQTSSLDNISGISQYFVKQNELTRITPYLFETKILLPLSASIANFDTSSQFQNYISGTLLPLIIPASITTPGSLQQNISTLSSLTSNSEASSVHNYLVDALGWFYFLNTSAGGGLSFDPSSYVLSSFNKLYLGKNLETIDGVKGFTNFIWKNYATCSVFSNLGLLPGTFVSGVGDSILEASDGTVATYTSGTQKLETLETLLDVIYSPAYMDEQDYRVQEAFDSYIDAQIFLEGDISKGPFRKFLTALGFSFADVINQVENIGIIYDIEEVPNEHIRYIADLIGWNLLGNSESKWRQQLRSAIDIYKKMGTLDALQLAANSLVMNSVFDLSGRVQELWESYIPLLIWYSLGTASPHFKDLTTWTAGKALKSGVVKYSTSSLEQNLKIVTDSILLDLFKAFPDNFVFGSQKFSPPKLYLLDDKGCPDSLYTVVGDPAMAPFHIHLPTDSDYAFLNQEADYYGEADMWDAAYSNGPLGTGVYMSDSIHPESKRPIYLSATGDLNFVFNFREHINYPIPPFEEFKYYKDCTVTAELVSLLVDRLKCFGVTPSFADQVGDYILSLVVTSQTNLGSLNEFLFFTSAVQIPPNYDNVLDNISDYSQNLLGLWNGKSSHVFIDFDASSFDFNKTPVSIEGDSRYALYDSSRIIKQFSPAHAIPRINLNTSAADDFSGFYSDYKTLYVGLDKDDTRASYTSASILGNFEISGVAMGSVSPGDNDGRGGLNTFKREDVDNITDTLLSSTTAITTAPRRALRRRNARYTLPLEGYYDRTAFDAPVNWDASTLENSMLSSLGELTLGYVASAGKFFPVVDPVNPSGVWHFCEGLDSSRTFSGVDTSNTFPYRGLISLGSNSNYVDRGQTPPLYITMHDLFEDKALDHAKQAIASFDSNVECALVGAVGVSSYGAIDNQLTDPTELSAWGRTPSWFTTISNVFAGPDGSITADLMEGSGTAPYGKISNIVIGPGGGYSPFEGGSLVPFELWLKKRYISIFNCDNILLEIYGSPEPDFTKVGRMAIDLNASTVSDITTDFYDQPSPISYASLGGTIEGAGDGWFLIKGNWRNTNQTHVYFNIYPDIGGGISDNDEVLFWKALFGGNELIDVIPSGGSLSCGIKYENDAYWKDIYQSYANSAIADGLVLNSFEDYRNFKWGTGLQELHRDYCREFGTHNINPAENDKTGGNIFAQVYGKGLYNCDFDLAGSAVSATIVYNQQGNPIGGGNYVASGLGDGLPINYNNGSGVFSTCAVAVYSDGLRNLPASGTYIASDSGEFVVPLSGTFISGNPTNAEFRNQNILSGIEFTQTSGASNSNQFRIFKIDKSLKVKGKDNYLINNSVIKCKSFNGLPRLRFDLSSYGDRQNKFVKDHAFKLKIKALVAEENSDILGGGQLGAWIHTNVIAGMFWTWTPRKRWELHREGDISLPFVKKNSHIYTFPLKSPPPSDKEFCFNLENTLEVNDLTLQNIKDSYFEFIEIDFDTENYTIYNNYEYLDKITVPEEYYKYKELVHDDTNYFIEIFFLPPTTTAKYLLLDNIELQDTTQRERAGIPTGHGVRTNGIPLRPFVKEDVLYLDKDQLSTVLKFYNGLMGQGTGLYATNLASRDATITSGVMEVSGGGRLNYRIQPDWTPGFTKQSGYNNYENVEFDN